MDLNTIYGILVLILIIILLLIFISLPLYLTARWLDEEEGFLRAVGTTILLIMSFLFCLFLIPYPIVDLIIAIIINLVIIKYAYNTEWGKAFAMWIITVLVAVIMLLILEFVLNLGLLVFP